MEERRWDFRLQRAPELSLPLEEAHRRLVSRQRMLPKETDRDPGAAKKKMGEAREGYPSPEHRRHRLLQTGLPH